MFGWGQTTSGAGTYVLATWLFLRLLGLIYLAAFVSLALQVRGLIGQRGILPVGEFLAERRRWGASRFWRIPTLCWFNGSDSFLLFLCWGGALLSLLLIAGVVPLVTLIVLWIFYLSLFSVCRIFLGYQWDILLLETGFLAILVAPLQAVATLPGAAPPAIGLWLLWWLLFRLMFSSGIVKLRSGDPSWRNLTALCHHYQTQPLPTPAAWHFHQFPPLFHKFSTALMFAIELVVPWFILAPGPLRYAAAIIFILFMALIQLTGNYCFFNLLGAALSVLLFDDAVLLPLWRAFLPGVEVPQAAIAPADSLLWISVCVSILILTLSILPLLRLFRFEPAWPKVVDAYFAFFERFRLVNSYGLFSVMTTERPEIIIEASHDGVTWQSYECKWKPGDPSRKPRFAAPHQPRLDWQLWFAALGYFPNNPWFAGFLVRLLEGSPEVLCLLRNNPFAGKAPRYIRAVLYDYRFTDRATRAGTGAWWRRERRGMYSPVIELGDLPQS